MLSLGDLWGCLGCLGVFWSVQGCFGSVGGCIHALRGIWEHFLLNSHQFPSALIKALTFSRRPEGPRCLKYWNVPKLWLFWAIGKHRERFQSWDIRVYFIPVPDDHTVEELRPSSSCAKIRFLVHIWILHYSLLQTNFKFSHLFVQASDLGSYIFFCEVRNPFKRLKSGIKSH